MPGLLSLRLLHAPVNQPELLPVGGTDAVVGPLADDAVVVGSHRINHRAGTAAVAIPAFGFAAGSPAGTVMHDGAVVVGCAAHDPVRFRNPIVVMLASGFDVLVMNRHVLVTVPALVFVMEAQHVAQFVDGHPFSLPPPKSRDVNVHA